MKLGWGDCVPWDRPRATLAAAVDVVIIGGALIRWVKPEVVDGESFPCRLNGKPIFQLVWAKPNTQVES